MNLVKTMLTLGVAAAFAIPQAFATIHNHVEVVPGVCEDGSSSSQFVHTTHGSGLRIFVESRNVFDAGFTVNAPINPHLGPSPSNNLPLPAGSLKFQALGLPAGAGFAGG